VPVATSNSWKPGSSTLPRTLSFLSCPSVSSISISWAGDADRVRWEGLEGEEVLNLRGGSMIGGDEDLETGIDMACKLEEMD